MMGNKDSLSLSLEGIIRFVVQISQGNFAKKLDQKNSENDYLIMPENFNKNLEQKRGPETPTPTHTHTHTQIRFGFFVKFTN